MVDPEDLKLAMVQGARVLSCMRNGLTYTEANTMDPDRIAAICAGMQVLLFNPPQGCMVLTPGEVSLAKPIHRTDFRRLALEFPQGLVMSWPQRIEGSA